MPEHGSAVGQFILKTRDGVFARRLGVLRLEGLEAYRSLNRNQN